MSVRLHVVIAASVWLVAVSASGVQTRAQGLSAPEGKIWTGVYTTAQAAQGELTFGSRCARCHASDLSGGTVGAAYAPALGGEKFLASWESRNVGRMFRTIKDTMPRDAPGLLNDQSAAEVVAFLLKYNGFPAGSQPLTADQAALDSVVIIPKAGAVRREVSNFASVQASGCVATGPGGAFLLLKATDPVVSPAAGPMVALSQTTGTGTMRLVSTAPFKLDTHVGERVMVKGLIRRDPDETLVNLLAVEPLGVRCN